MLDKWSLHTYHLKNKLKMTREALFQLVIHSLHTGDVANVTSLVIEHNQLSKTFTGEELNTINLAFKSSIVHPDTYNFFVKNNLYKKGTGACAFINELPFITGIDPNTDRYFTPQNYQTSIPGYPDVIDVNRLTGLLQGYELKNYLGKQYLPELRYGNKYEIIRSKENFDYYRVQYENIKLRSYEELKYIDPQIAVKRTYYHCTKLTNTVFQFNGIKNIHIPRCKF